MKSLLLIIVSALVLFAPNLTCAQTREFAPLAERRFEYRNWSLKSVGDGKEIDLRKFAEGKKLVLVVYFAPWCPNWATQKPFIEKLYGKYKADGFGVIAVSEYGAPAETEKLLTNKEASYQIVINSTTYDARTTTDHYKYRQQTEDKRRWGSPWHLFFEPAAMHQKGDVLLDKAFVVNGELIEADIEKFVREKLGLPAEAKKENAPTAKVEACAPNEKKIALTNSKP